MTSIADRFMAEFASMVADEVVRKLAGGDAPSRRPVSVPETVDRLLTPYEVADILRTKKNTLAVWRMTPGAGPDFVKRGRLIFYTPEAVQAYIERNSHSDTGR